MLPAGTEKRLDRRVNIQVQNGRLDAAHQGEALLGNELMQLHERFIVETAQVAIDRVQARHDSAAQMHEQRVGRERFQAEDALFSGDECIDEHAHLLRHGIDDRRPLLEPVERSKAPIEA
jgi:hypothetical protein